MSASTGPRPSVPPPLADVVADLDRIHAKLITGNPTPEMLAQVHEFLDIDPDIAGRVYPPMPHARKAVAR